MGFLSRLFGRNSMMVVEIHVRWSGFVGSTLFEVLEARAHRNVSREDVEVIDNFPSASSKEIAAVAVERAKKAGKLTLVDEFQFNFLDERVEVLVFK